MIKRLLKVILFIPACLASLVFFPFAGILWIITGQFPESPLQNVMEVIEKYK